MVGGMTPRRIPAPLIALLAAFALWPAASAQGVTTSNDNPVNVRVEIYVVSQVTKDDGTKEERFTEATTARPGQVVEYRLFAKNVSDTTLPAGIVQITGPIPDGMAFIADSATPSSERVLTEYSADGGRNYSKPPVLVGTAANRSVAVPADYTGVRWTLLVPLEPGAEEPFFYRVTVK
jgi:uncharacterized repeat protein (TIGR01451 family)